MHSSASSRRRSRQAKAWQQMQFANYIGHGDAERLVDRVLAAQDFVFVIFSEEAELTVRGTTFRGHERLMEFISNATTGRHLTTNVGVSIDGDTGTVYSDFIAVGRVDGRLVIQFAGRYSDTVAHGPNGWRITSRTITLD